MEKEVEQDDAQPEVIEEQAEVELTAQEIADLQKAAEVSSQNFERAKKAEQARKALEEENALLKSQLETDQFSEPDNIIQKQIKELSDKFSAIEQEKQLEALCSQYPALKDKRSEFDSYRTDYPGGKLEAIAKLFLAENNLLEEPVKRKGLEKAGGGQRVAPQQGKYSAEDVKRLRETNFKQYMKLVRSGKLQLNK